MVGVVDETIGFPDRRVEHERESVEVSERPPTDDDVDADVVQSEGDCDADAENVAESVADSVCDEVGVRVGGGDAVPDLVRDAVGSLVLDTYVVVTVGVPLDFVSVPVGTGVRVLVLCAT